MYFIVIHYYEKDNRLPSIPTEFIFLTYYIFHFLFEDSTLIIIETVDSIPITTTIFVRIISHEILIIKKKKHCRVIIYRNKLNKQ